ncbi:MAG: hypothetical protein KGK03_09945 [Candidatus Omnitrophica bacterium]|nr:hypothetical protein [Candidatus Omnitrophota bacterium]MDE2223373.1 hypothetical protein [Candidatus Omnitrophota bacterium]
MKKLKFKKCCLCGNPVYNPKAKYCLRCRNFTYCMKNRRINGKAAQRIKAHVKRHGFVCEYTGVDLDTENRASPYYFEFDHETPGVKRMVRLTCSLVNEMKSDTSWPEFRGNIFALAKCFKTGAKLKRRKLKYWYRLRPPVFYRESKHA